MILRARKDFAPAQREKSCECYLQNQSLAPRWEKAIFKCLDDLSDGVMDNDLRPAEKTQFFISDSHQ
jgi:hypothetical protein